MTIAFADTFLWLALVHPRDAWHQRVTAYLDAYAGRLVTTDWVLVELGDALAGTAAGR